jgi:phosphoglycerol transferase
MRLEALRAAAVAMVGLLAACVVLRLDRADLWIPFSYSSDALLQATWAKTLLEQPWVHRNPALAAPFVQQYYDFPLFKAANLILEKVLGWIGGSWAFSLNAYYILTFPLVAGCSYLALVKLGVSALPAAIVSVVYTLLPYHLYRGVVDLFLSGYHIVPLCALVAIWVALGELTTRRRLGIAAAIMVVTVSSGIHYSLFAAWFLVVAALYAAVRYRAWGTLPAVGVLLAVFLAAGLLNLAPNLNYWRQKGMTTIVHRMSAESTQYGFRLASALMPIPDHRVPALARVRQSFSRAAPTATSVGSGAQSFGALASLGFLALLAAPFATRVAGEAILALSCLTYAGILLATTTGLGQMFVSLVAPLSGAWDRIVPFLAFFALAAVAMALDRIRAHIRPGVGRRAFAVAATGLGILAIGDQTSPALIPDYAAIRAEVRSDRVFFRGVASRLPPRSMIFQLPYVPFPESPPLHRLTDYDLFRPYLSTTSLRWSYGAVRSRFADAWIAAIAARPVPDMVRALALAGFRGIVVDGYGYADGGAALDAELLRFTRQEGRNARYTWYALDGFAAQQRASLGDVVWEARRKRLLRPIYLEWQRGFYPLEAASAPTLRWSKAKSVLAVDNPGDEAALARLSTRVCTGRREPAEFTIRSEDVDYSIQVTSECADVRLSFLLHSGRTFLRFATDAQPAAAPGDARALYFRLEDFRFDVDDDDVDILQNM